MNKILLSAALIATFVAAFLLINSPLFDKEVVAHTEKYVYREGESTHLIIYNKLNDTIYLDSCNPTVIYKKNGSEFEIYGSYANCFAAFFCDKNINLFIEPRKTKHLYQSYAAGIYKFNFSAHICKGGEPYRSVDIVSNEFRIE